MDYRILLKDQPEDLALIKALIRRFGDDFHEMTFSMFWVYPDDDGTVGTVNFRIGPGLDLNHSVNVDYDFIGGRIRLDCHFWVKTRDVDEIERLIRSALVEAA